MLVSEKSIREELLTAREDEGDVEYSKFVEADLKLNEPGNT